MADGLRKLQAAIVAALSGLTDENASAVPVYDHVPQDLSQPYVSVVGGTRTSDDTKTGDGIEHDVELHVYSAYRGLQQVKYVMDQIYDTLNRGSLTASGYQVVPGRFTFSTEFIEPDGSRGVMRFNIRVYPE